MIFFAGMGASAVYSLRINGLGSYGELAGGNLVGAVAHRDRRGGRVGGRPCHWDAEMVGGGDAAEDAGHGVSELRV